MAFRLLGPSRRMLYINRFNSGSRRVHHPRSRQTCRRLGGNGLALPQRASAQGEQPNPRRGGHQRARLPQQLPGTQPALQAEHVHRPAHQQHAQPFCRERGGAGGTRDGAQRLQHHPLRLSRGPRGVRAQAREPHRPPRGRAHPLRGHRGRPRAQAPRAKRHPDALHLEPPALFVRGQHARRQPRELPRGDRAHDQGGPRAHRHPGRVARRVRLARAPGRRARGVRRGGAANASAGTAT